MSEEQEFEEFLEYLLAKVKAGEAEVHIVPVAFQHGECMSCGENDELLLPVGPNGQLYCAKCGQRENAQTEEYFEYLFDKHLKQHVAHLN